MLGWATPEEAIGQTFVTEGSTSGIQRGQVIGVVEDFHFESLHERITPLLFYSHPAYLWQMTVKVAGRDMQETLAFLEAQWAPYQPNQSFNYAFVDETFGELYDAEQRLGHILGIFAVLAIVIACLGLFGLAAHTAAQRTKEIGIRKVLGASIPHLLLLLTRHIVLLVAMAFVIAAPIAYLVMQRWLSGFAYQADLGLGLFILAGSLVLAIALATVSYQALRATLADPVKSLRYE
jgi:putative ABC transport system permease protein